MPYANNKGADQPAHHHSLISAFVIRCLDSTTPLLARLQLVSVQFESLLVTNPEDRFSRDVAYVTLAKKSVLILNIRTNKSGRTM